MSVDLQEIKTKIKSFEIEIIEMFYTTGFSHVGPDTETDDIIRLQFEGNGLTCIAEIDKKQFIKEAEQCQTQTIS